MNWRKRSPNPLIDRMSTSPDSHPSLVFVEMTTLASFMLPPGIVRDALVAWSILVIFAYPIKWCLPSNVTKFLVSALDSAERIYHGAEQKGLFANLDSVPAHMQELLDIEDALQRSVFY